MRYTQREISGKRRRGRHETSYSIYSNITKWMDGTYFYEVYNRSHTRDSRHRPIDGDKFNRLNAVSNTLLTVSNPQASFVLVLRECLLAEVHLSLRGYRIHARAQNMYHAFQLTRTYITLVRNPCVHGLN